MSYTATDEFCGAGGSSTGLVAAGLTVKLALNHWDRAIETHAANHPDTDHRCVDVTKTDKRTWPKTHVFWASPICTEESPGGGRKKRKKPPTVGQLLLEEEAHVPQEGHERTRATFWDVLQATEVNRYPIVIVENVVEVYAWELIDLWMAAMERLGYHLQIVCVSAAHVGQEQDNGPAPQWRDRMYFFLTRNDLTPPKIEPTPRSWCFTCEREVFGIQSWKNPKSRVGKYRSQYVYRCPSIECRHSIVEPLVLPAAAAIDWSDLGERLGDRKKPLVEATMRRIRAGADLIAAPYLTSVNHESGRHYAVDERPLSARTGKIGDSLVIPGSYITTLRRNAQPRDVLVEPLATMATARHQWVTIPGAFIQKHHGGVDYPGVSHMVKDVHEPLSSVVGRPNLSLVIPYRAGSKPSRTTEQPFSALATVEQHATLMAPATDADVADYHFRMIKWRESANAQRFPGDYVFTGNSSENTMLAGNAVASNVAQWLAGYAIATLDGAA